MFCRRLRLTPVRSGGCGRNETPFFEVDFGGEDVVSDDTLPDEMINRAVFLDLGPAIDNGVYGSVSTVFEGAGHGLGLLAAVFKAWSRGP